MRFESPDGSARSPELDESNRALVLHYQARGWHRVPEPKPEPVKSTLKPRRKKRS